MAPKAKAEGPKASKPPETPQRAKTEAPKSTPKAATPKKTTKEIVLYRPLKQDTANPIPVTVAFEGGSETAKLGKTGSFSHTVKLEASASFALVNTLVFNDGPLEGLQAIIIRPAKAFPFLKLTKELRTRIYKFYFTPKSDVIPIEAKRKDTKDMYAKVYADGSKDRVGLLAVSKEINKEATPILYDHTLKLESTSALLEFLTQVESAVLPLLKQITLKTYTKTAAKTAFQSLAKARNLEKLTIETAVYGLDDDPAKAVKAFDAEAHKFLVAMGSSKGSADAGVDILAFGPSAFTYKDDGKVKNWPKGDVEDFKDQLRTKLLEA